MNDYEHLPRRYGEENIVNNVRQAMTRREYANVVTRMTRPKRFWLPVVLTLAVIATLALLVYFRVF
jgi:Mg2+/citrate symporter